MATSNSAGNLITMTAAGDTARVGVKMKLAGVCVVSNSPTLPAVVRLRNGASTADIIPYVAAKTGALLALDRVFNPPLEVTGLKATNCTNANISVYVV